MKGCIRKANLVGQEWYNTVSYFVGSNLGGWDIFQTKGTSKKKKKK